ARAKYSGCIIEPFIGREFRVTVELVERAVEAIGAALSYHAYLGSARPALLCIRVRCDNSELLYGIESHSQNTVEGQTPLVVVYVTPVWGFFHLVVSAAIHRSFSDALGIPTFVWFQVSYKSDARL